MPSPSTLKSANELRDTVESIFVLGLRSGGQARQIAEEALGAKSAHLRGYAAFERAYRLLLQLPGSSIDSLLVLNDGEHRATTAGEVLRAWMASPSNRSTLFDESGACGPTILVLQVSGVDTDALWKDDGPRGPTVVAGGPDAELVFFETAPALHYDKRPDDSNGAFLKLQGNDISLKRRGNACRWDPKLNLTIALQADEVSGFPGQLNFMNCIRDPSYERARLAWTLMAEARCPFERCAYAELSLNGHYQGTYLAMPSVDDYYFRRFFPDVTERAVFRGQYGDIHGGATLAYRGPSGSDYLTEASIPTLRTYEPRLGTRDIHYEALAKFIDVLNNGADPKTSSFADRMANIFDVEVFLRTMVVTNLTGAWDNYYLNAQNYLLHIALAARSNASSSPYVTFCAYDMESALGMSWSGQQRNWHEKDILFRDAELGELSLLKRTLENPAFRRYYCDFMAWFIETCFTPDWFNRQRATLWDRLERSVYLESATPYGKPDTARPWTNDDVYRHAVLDIDLKAYGSSSVSGLEVMGIGDFVRRRRNTALSLLRQEPIGASRVDFDSNIWSLR